MILKSLSLLNFRNYSHLNLELPEGGALFYGVNGSGKTNLLESISYVLLGKSPRGAGVKDLVSVGERESFVKAVLTSGEQTRVQSIGFSRDKQLVITRDGETSTSLRALYGENRFVWFGPDDIQLITGSPEEKRRFIDITLSQVSPEYLAELMRYKKLIRERNALITGRFDSVLCDIYDHDLAQSMAAITAQRAHFFAEISSSVTSVYNQISGAESDVVVEFAPSLQLELPDEFELALKERRNRDREQGFTSIGPHRDSFRCKKDGRQIVGYGSQGQCRSSALALKIASTEYLTRDNHELILAVDDAFSDLDRTRREIFFDMIRTKGQLFVAVHSREELSYYDLPALSITQGKVVPYELG